ncbi:MULTISPECIES: pyrroline-5-carboxylate reductase [Pseudarthrobacter]|uniref:Pyrroline-5-carboxylate reductase n=1 Tax=Pseudarthrobacter niigatensis TaxID=369935 RepID=A0AAJ1SS67_9MICC|nr:MULTISPECIES: pyrroline-5-carboxylate reductase [Pseudarthrobacter]MDQ0146201.1 pyrroline-5-carboxylate reductase [Pseudarthrobacter niigatensis]MDQ0266071.1 pyrroline-5-carboxylate reductase [Pseudarthrobacter niigatensis]QDG62379.1 pyrroline-5-carboxylate reductase [Pseudarthrobacter sp. NIBRBAC000502771]QDG89593.1 pyrroline-5-carboxylate reductase [Pseudarthrobacter sp. NIBRBAC000502770]
MSNRIAFLGCGSMNEAILGGLLEAGKDPGDVVATVRRAERASELAQRYQGITAIAGEEEPDNNRQAAKGSAVVILGVKPVGIADLAREISPALSPETVVVSVAAAVSIAQLEAALPAGQPVIRTMPNTPAKLGRGVVSVSPGTHCSPEQLQMVKDLLQGAGTVVEVPEEQVDALSAISGSGPAYAFYLAEAMASAGEELGLDRELSLLLARETVAGAGLMLAEPGADPAALRKAVTSPNGTTERAIATFDEQGIPAIIAAGARAAADRAAEITRQLG